MDASSSRHARDESHIFSSSDDNAIMKYILATHAPNGTYFDVKPFLEIIENIVHMANQANQAEPGSTVERRFISNDVNEILEVMAITINKVCCEISSKCIGGGDAHTTTMGILNMLSNYAWDAKAVIALSAFALNYAEFWLVAQLYISNPLARSVSRLKQLPDMQESGNALKLRFQAVTNLTKSMLDLTRCIVEIKMLPEQYISPETPELVIATTHIAAAVYWIIQSIVACASILINLVQKGQEHIVKTIDGWELSSLAHKISNFHDHLKNQLVLCYQHIDEKKKNEAYQTIVRIMDTPHRDNVTPLKHLIYSKDDQLPLYRLFTDNRVSIEALKKKIVLLLISDLDLSIEEYWIFNYMHGMMRMETENKYEVVWLPVVPDDTETPFDEVHQRQFEESRRMIPWFILVCDPLLLQPAVIKYIKEDWHFNHKPILVVMDPQGRIVNTNALHMIWTWGIEAFPFTSQKEEALWKEETWRMGLLDGGFDPRISEWIADGKYICLYGGVDIEWIRKFTLIAKDVARAAEIPLEMMYVGKSNTWERLLRINDIIRRENLGDILLYEPHYFWVRLENMFYSKSKHNKSSDLDPILQEIITMLTYDGNDEGWSVICHGSNDWMHRANGETVLTGLTNYNDWKDNAQQKGFLPALNDYLMEISTPHHCNRLILPGTTGPDRVACVECGRLMERFVMYRCCFD
uniref:protein SIEVE ELEMENT OCCLUSION B-like n=1 Tax=Erigeron canadensis TaxID=72917 RepID=UPI001CB978D6|nr:protein SIEVE ELEMENT OCCLUSION B-like [Erigeron canadensis]